MMDLMAGIMALALAQSGACLSDVRTRADVFDLTGAVEQIDAARAAGCEGATEAASYLRGLLAARRAYAQGGSEESLRPVVESIAALERNGGTVSGPAQIAVLVLHAASAAAQSEREEMAIYLDQAIRIESLQLAAGQPPAPIITAHEVAGDLWLQVHRFDEARAAYERALAQVGSNPRILLGRARAAARANDARACTAYADLLSWWGSRAVDRAEIAEARDYVRGTACRAGAAR